MSGRAKWTIGTICAILAASLPATALAVFPGTNGKILFVSGREDGDGEADVFIIDGPNDLTLAGPTDLIAGQHRHPNWSADGKSIVYAIRAGGDEDLYIKDTVLGGTVIFSGGSADNVLEDHPAFSPDGSRIAYESEVSDPDPPNAPTQEDILISESDGTGPIANLTNTGGTVFDQTPAWSPDNEFIYYATKENAAADFNIVREPPSGGAVDTVEDAATAGNEFQPEISPDGTKMCYTLGPFGSDDADVMVANVDSSGTPYEVSNFEPITPIADYDCSWSPDGKIISWTRGAFGTGQLQFAPSNDSGPITPYGNNSAFFDGNVDWSPIPGECNNKPATIAGDDGDDELKGTPGKDVIVSFKGDDTVKGRGGNDKICAGKGKDFLKGGGGRDKLFAGPGRDTLNGGGDRDRCDGGPGKDEATKCERKIGI